MMQPCTLNWDIGKCNMKTKFFLLLLPARFLLGPTEDGGPKPGDTPDTRAPPSADLPHLGPIPETPGDGRGRPRLRDPDHGHGHDRRRGRTPDHERRTYPTRRPGDHPEEEDEEEAETNNRALEDQLRHLLEKWERDLDRLRRKLKEDLLSL
ncbi:putative protein E4 [Bos taurus papillomavirus 3]|uniref:E4 protein n=2 Tax=Bovine papillomavirus type 3 TaxID=2758957 RepID=Q8BDD5_BPV3|nr:putative protein E4 [Xipapillomavirus 1]AAN09959.1 putative protein E4 [Bos taurus papillomavirus 3]CAF05681.1 E4 protein [Xipapillomavirus 1]